MSWRRSIIALTLLSACAASSRCATAQEGCFADDASIAPDASLSAAAASDDDAGDELSLLPLFEWFPAKPLWQPPLANQREPRMVAKFHSLDDRWASDVAAGDYIPVIRWCSSLPELDEAEIDVFGAIFLRILDFEDVYACDGRVGIAFSWRCDRWTGKLGYEHTSCHLIDEFIVNTGQILVENYARDEVTLGLSYYSALDCRWYGQAGYCVRPWTLDTLSGETVTTGPRCFTGIEWYASALACDLGQPYLAADVDVRAEQDYSPNITLQAGWRMFAGCCRNPFFCVEYYHGKSPFGQFLLVDESWFAFTIAIDR